MGYVTETELMNRLAEIQQRTVVEVEAPWWVSAALLVLCVIAAACMLLVTRWLWRGWTR